MGVRIMEVDNIIQLWRDKGGLFHVVRLMRVGITKNPRACEWVEAPFGIPEPERIPYWSFFAWSKVPIYRLLHAIQRELGDGIYYIDPFINELPEEVKVWKIAPIEVSENELVIPLEVIDPENPKQIAVNYVMRKLKEEPYVFVRELDEEGELEWKLRGDKTKREGAEGLKATPQALKLPKSEEVADALLKILKGEVGSTMLEYLKLLRDYLRMLEQSVNLINFLSELRWDEAILYVFANYLEKNRVEIALRMLKEGKVSLGMASKLAGLPVDKMKKLAVEKGIEWAEGEP